MDATYATFVEGLVIMANNSTVTELGDMKELMAANETVFAVWDDAAEDFGVGLLCVKGENLWRELAATNSPRKVKMNAVRCHHLGQAQLLQLMFGDKLN